MTRRQRSWPSTSVPPKTSTATWRSLSRCSPTTAFRWRCIAIASMCSCATIGTGPRHWFVEEQLAGRQHPTHVGRMLSGLGVGYIASRSPQAKGRIEQLWVTLQDRLVSELRVGAIATVEAAHAYLPE